jgi:DnaJ-class molecular chaperone
MNTRKVENPYSLLGVSQGASKEEIKKAYKKLAMQHHPDKGGDEKIFKEITNAYNTLTNDSPQEHQFHQHPFNDMDMFSQMFGGRGGGNPFGGFGGFGRQQSRQETHRDKMKPVKKAIIISMKDAFKGTTKKVHIVSDDPCNECTHVCGECRGTGMRNVQTKTQMGNAFIIQTQTIVCTYCVEGNVSKHNPSCALCKGKGNINTNKIITITIEPGTQNNKTFTFTNIIPNTILNFVISIENMENYTIDNNNLVYVQTISFLDSIFGKTFELEHPSGEKVNVNTKTFKNIVLDRFVFIIPEKGMTKQNKMQIIFSVDYPKEKNGDIDEDELNKAKHIIENFIKIY